jgi:hypothetical protein
MSPLLPRTAPEHESRIQDYPALAGLQLSNVDLQRLTQQGFVSRETRRGNACFKLRFRRDGNQHVKYLSAGQAAAVRAELAELQGATRFKQNLAAATRAARQVLCQSKRNLQPVLATRGWAFHGLAIRRPRRRNPTDLQSTAQPTR